MRDLTCELGISLDEVFLKTIKSSSDEASAGFHQHYYPYTLSLLITSVSTGSS